MKQAQSSDSDDAALDAANDKIKALKKSLQAKEEVNTKLKADLDKQRKESEKLFKELDQLKRIHVQAKIAHKEEIMALKKKLNGGGIWNHLKDEGKKLITAGGKVIKEGMEDFGEAVLDEGEEIIDAVGDEVQSVAGKVGDEVEDAFEDSTDSWGDAAEEFISDLF